MGSAMNARTKELIIHPIKPLTFVQMQKMIVLSCKMSVGCHAYYHESPNFSNIYLIFLEYTAVETLKIPTNGPYSRKMASRDMNQLSHRADTDQCRLILVYTVW